MWLRRAAEFKGAQIMQTFRFRLLQCLEEVSRWVSIDIFHLNCRFAIVYVRGSSEAPPPSPSLIGGDRNKIVMHNTWCGWSLSRKSHTKGPLHRDGCYQYYNFTCTRPVWWLFSSRWLPYFPPSTTLYRSVDQPYSGGAPMPWTTLRAHIFNNCRQTAALAGHVKMAFMPYL